MEAWVVITIGAAFAQNARSALQKALKGRLSSAGAAYARFVYALPFAALYLIVVLAATDAPLPSASTGFIFYLLAGSLSQILFTVVLMWLFSLRSFAVGTTFSKLDILLIALFGAVLLGDGITLLAGMAIALGVLGTVLLSMGQTGTGLRQFVSGIGERSTLVGLLCAILLGLSFVFFRGALLALGDGPYFLNAAFALCCALAVQTLAMGLWFVIFDRAQLAAIARHWRPAGLVSVIGVVGSIGWFTAFSLQSAAYVSAVGKIELVFAYLSSRLIFGETVTRLETVGIVLVTAGVVVMALI